jgi:hypothetical protein
VTHRALGQPKIKINVDTTFFLESGCPGVMRDMQGPTSLFVCRVLLNCKDVEEVELLACREGLNLSPTMYFTAVHTGNILPVGLQYSEVIDKLCDLESSIQI